MSNGAIIGIVTGSIIGFIIIIMIILYCIGFFTSQNTGVYGKTDRVNDTQIDIDVNQECY